MDEITRRVKEMVVRNLYLNVEPQSLDDAKDIIDTFNLDDQMMVGVFDGIDQSFGFLVHENLRQNREFRTIRGISTYIRDQKSFWKSKALNVVAEIQVAFKDVKRGDGVTLHEADVIDNYGSAKERKAARKLDSEDGWQSVPSKDIEKYYWILSFLDPTGYRYYLPAYMVWTLKNYETNDSIDSACSTVYSLNIDATNKAELRQYHLERFERFNQSQSRAIARFLEQMANCGFAGDHKSARSALKDYWQKFQT